MPTGGNVTPEGNRVIVVTGAAGAIGRPVASLLARGGSSVALFDIDLDAARAIADEIVVEGGVAKAYRVDVTSTSAFDTAGGHTITEFDHIDGLANNAGINGGYEPIPFIPEDEFDRVIAVSMKSTCVGMRAVLPHLRERGRGSIVNVSSAAGLIGHANKGAYTAAKQGVIGLTKVAAIENRDTSIRVNAVCPESSTRPSSTTARFDDRRRGGRGSSRT